MVIAYIDCCGHCLCRPKLIGVIGVIGMVVLGKWLVWLLWWWLWWPRICGDHARSGVRGVVVVGDGVVMSRSRSVGRAAGAAHGVVGVGVVMSMSRSDGIAVSPLPPSTSFEYDKYFSNYSNTLL